MIKRTLIIIISLLGFRSGLAQADSLSVKKFNRFFVAVTGGLTTPVGSFAVYNPNGTASFHTGINYAGVPKIGLNGKVEAMYLPIKDLGFILTYFNTVNKADTLSQNQVFPYRPNTALGGGYGQTLTNYSTKSWSTNNILLGVAANFDVDRVKIRLKLSGGWQQVKSPETKINSILYVWSGISQQNFQSSTSAFSIMQPAMTSRNFVFGAGMDVSVRFVKKLGLIVSIDYLGSFASFNGNLIDQNGNKTPNSFTQKISLFLFNLGLCYELK